jgi:hypothetical protein
MVRCGYASDGESGRIMMQVLVACLIAADPISEEKFTDHVRRTFT